MRCSAVVRQVYPEIGFGMGETSATIAETNPQNDYIGVEVHTPGVGSLCKLIAEKNLATSVTSSTMPWKCCAT